MSTNTPISTINLSSAASSITFSSIPQTYTDLVLIASVKSVTAPAGIKYRLNGDTGSNYSHNTLTATGSVIASEKQSLTTGLLAYYGYTDTVNYGLYQHNFMNYAKTDYYKASIGRSDNTSGAGVALMTNTWRNNSAITSISVFLDSGNMASGSTFNLYGIVAASGYATGGNLITTDGTYWYHTFTSSGAFTPTRALTADYLVVAGGAGGGGGFGLTDTRGGGGGGAGGLRSTVTATGGGGSLESALSLTGGTSYTVTVGSGGAAGVNSSSAGTNGSNSVFSTITSTGGGGGGRANASNAASGGSGGGQGTPTSGTSTGADGTANQGFKGGDNAAARNTGAGGGGAGAVGANAGNSPDPGGNGGAGVAVSITGSSVVYAGGGGGAGAAAGSGPGAGGTGGGGAGGTHAGGVNATAGTANTGGGGGGGAVDGANSGSPAAGGSGIVIVRYAV